MIRLVRLWLQPALVGLTRPLRLCLLLPALLGAGLTLGTEPADAPDARSAVTQAINAGKLQQAELLLKDWETRDADNAFIPVFRAIILLKLGQREYAMQRVRQLAQRDLPLDATIQLATLFFDLGLRDTALKLLDDKRRKSLSAAELHQLAGAYYAIAAANRARQVWLRAIRIKSKPANGKLLLGIISGLQSVSERQESSPALERVEMRNLDADDLLLLGHQLAQRQSWPRAQRALQMAAILNPHQDNLWFLLGNALLQSGQPRSAAAAYRREIDRDAYSLDTWLQLVQAQRAAGLPNQAIIAYGSTLRILKSHYTSVRVQDNPDHHGYLLQQLARYAQIADAQTQLYLSQRAPGMPLFHWNLTWLQKALPADEDELPLTPLPARLAGQTAEAVIGFAERELNARLAEALRLQQAGDSAQSLADFAKDWLQDDAENYWAHFIHGVALMALDERDDAERALLRAQELEAKRLEASLLLSTLYQRTGQAEKLVQVRERLHELRLDKTSALLDAANAYIDNGEDAEAYRIYQQLLERDGHDPLLWQVLAKFYQDRGMFGELNELYLRLKRVQPVTAERIAAMGLF